VKCVPWQLGAKTVSQIRISAIGLNIHILTHTQQPWPAVPKTTHQLDKSVATQRELIHLIKTDYRILSQKFHVCECDLYTALLGLLTHLTIY
jgi:hypothetical protein